MADIRVLRLVELPAGAGFRVRSLLVSELSRPGVSERDGAWTQQQPAPRDLVIRGGHLD